MTRILKTYWLPLACIAAALVKVALCLFMPLNVHAGATYDDVWAVRAADFLASGQWLGAYDYTTLVKNIGFPLFLAACIKLGIGYLLASALLYVAASAYFTAALRPLFKRPWLVFAIFLLVLFNPVSFATDTYQRVYRNSITAAQCLFVFGSYIAVYVRLKRDGLRLGSLVGWLIVACVGLAWFWISREDVVWIAPFVLVATAVTVVSAVRLHLRRGVLAGLCVALVLPLFCTGATVAVVRAVNQSKYGVAVTAEIDEGNFARVVQDLYAIEPAVQPENLLVACTHESLERAYNESPTLSKIKTQVENRFYYWGDRIDNNPADREVNGGEFPWVLRLAANDAGEYASAQKADAFYGAVADELEQAFSSGALAKRSGMPLSTLTPWRAEYADCLPEAIAGTIVQAVCYGDVTAQPSVAQGPDEGIAYFEAITGNRAYADGAPVPYACAIAEGIVWIYRIVLPLLAILGLVAFVVLLVLCLIPRFAQGADWRIGTLSLIAAALLLGCIPLVCGLAYTRISSFVPIAYYYYGSALYPLFAAFGGCALGGLFEMRGCERGN